MQTQSLTIIEGFPNGMQLVTIDQNDFAVLVSNNNVSVNLTKMAQPFGKRPERWLVTKEAQSYLKTLSNVLSINYPDAQKCVTADLLIISKGGAPNEQGTWAHDYRIVMRFAQWLSPEFSIKVDELLVNLMQNNVRPHYTQGKLFEIEPKPQHNITELLKLIKQHLIHGDQLDIAKSIGVTQKTVGMVLNGETKNSPRVLAALYNRALQNKRKGLVIGNIKQAIIKLNK